MEELKVEVKNVYGVEKIYPRCEKSELFAQIAGTKTLTRETIELIKKLGYEICVVKNSGVFAISLEDNGVEANNPRHIKNKQSGVSFDNR